ncbi:MAG: serine/threonine-protein kinase [Planctomycetia bacterium]|nr:serine/threonine-protein kinase [Planctomycetia bacterium]
MSHTLPTHFGPFDVQSRIGRGGMGAVYRGIHQTTKVPVAIKVLAEPLADDENFRQRFNKEIAALRQLRHPNIVRLLGSGLQDDFCYYVMELIDGPSLEKEIRAGRRFSWRETLRIAIQISSALNCAHAHGIIHRDLKPANLLLTPEGNVKLSDFGIATLFGSSKITSLGSIIGTLNYMSPEQAAAEPVSARSDLFSFGAVLTALMTGTPPFSGSTLPEIIHQHVSRRARRPSQLGVEIPVEFDELIGRLLERNPDRRPKNAYFVYRMFDALQHELSDNTEESAFFAEQADSLVRASVPVPLSTDVLQKRLFSNRLERMPEMDTEDDVENEFRKEAETENLELGSETATEYFSENISENLSGNKIENVMLQRDSTSSSVSISPSAAITPVVSIIPSGTTHDFMLGNSLSEENTEVEKKTEKISEASPTPSFFLPETEETPENAESPWSALLMVLILSAVLIFFVAHIIRTWSTPPEADKLFARIQEAAEDEKAVNSDRFIQDVDLFLTCYSQDERAPQVREYQTEIDLNRLEKKLLLNSFGNRFRSASPIERDYLNAIRNLQTRPVETQQKLEDFVLFYESACETLRKSPGFSQEELNRNTQYISVARRQLSRIRKVLQSEQDARRPILVAEVQRVLELLRSSDPEDIQRGEALRVAILRLYSTTEPELVAPLKE